jgi:chlorophyllide a reductase subunit Z
MGYSGATYVIQEVCNALFDALFHILPLGTDMDKAEATHARGVTPPSTSWADDAQALLRELVQHQPVLVQISAAKRLRDLSEKLTRQAGEYKVNLEYVQSAAKELGLGAVAA